MHFPFVEVRYDRNQQPALSLNLAFYEKIHVLFDVDLFLSVALCLHGRSRFLSIGRKC